METEKPFVYQFEDKEWMSKLGLGALIGMVPILNIAWTGYITEIVRNVIDGVAQPLPEWDDIGKKFSDGLMLFLAGLVYAAPVLVLLFGSIGFMAASGVLTGSRDLENVGRTLLGVGGVLFACLLCLIVLYGLALSVIWPAILVLYAREGTFAACFKFREMIDMISRNSGPFLTVWGLSLVAGIAVSMATGFVTTFIGWVPCIGWAAAVVLGLGSVVYTGTIQAHLVGQFGRLTTEHTEITEK